MGLPRQWSRGTTALWLEHKDTSDNPCTEHAPCEKANHAYAHGKSGMSMFQEAEWMDLGAYAPLCFRAFCRFRIQYVFLPCGLRFGASDFQAFSGRVWGGEWEGAWGHNSCGMQHAQVQPTSLPEDTISRPTTSSGPQITAQACRTTSSAWFRREPLYRCFLLGNHTLAASGLPWFCECYHVSDVFPYQRRLFAAFQVLSLVSSERRAGRVGSRWCAPDTGRSACAATAHMLMISPQERIRTQCANFRR